MILTTIDRYLLRRLVATLAKTLLALVVLYILIDLMTHRSAAIQRNDVPWSIVLQYYLSLSPGIIANYVAPFAVLVSALLVLGETAQNNEVTAALAGGVSLRRFVRMPILVAPAFVLAVFAMQETIGVAAARNAIRIERNYFSRNPETERIPVSRANLSGKWTCHIMKFNRLALTGEGVFIYALEANAQYQIEAKRILWDDERGRWLLERGWRHELGPAMETRRSARITQEPAPFTETPEDLFALEQPPETKSSRELAGDLAQAQNRQMNVNPLLVRYHAKFSQPALSFVIIWLAIPFAMRLRRGGLAISFGTSIATAFVYITLFFIAMGLGQMGRLSPFVAAWLANAVFLVVGVILFLRTPT